MKTTTYREFLSTAPQPGVRLFALRSDRFKTVRLRVYLCDALRPRDATETALLAYALRAGSAEYPSRRDLARACENLYGATVGVSVTRFGDVQALAGSAEFPADMYLPRGTGELRGVLNLLGGMLLRPALAGGTLRPEVVAQEKSQLENDLRGLRDEKPAWASFLAAQRIYAGTAGAIHEQGSLDDLPDIDAVEVTARHAAIVRDARVFAFITGPIDPARGLAALARHLRFPASRRPALPKPAPLRGRPRAQKVHVDEQTEQTHLICAWTGGPLYGSADFAPMLFADGIFGGFSFSRLFKVVREEHGLAYAVSSAFQRARGVLVCQAAVDPGKAAKAAALMRTEFTRLARHGFTDAEFAACRDSLIESRISAWDSPSARVSDTVLQAVMGFRESTDAQLRRIRAVKPAQVRAILRKLRPHTDFRLGAAG